MLSKCKVGAIVFFVGDLARSVTFYRDTLGLPIGVVEGHDGSFATGQVGELSLVFIVHDAPAGESPVVVFSLEGASTTTPRPWRNGAWRSWCRWANRPMAGCRWISSIRTAICSACIRARSCRGAIPRPRAGASARSALTPPSFARYALRPFNRRRA